MGLKRFTKTEPFNTTAARQLVAVGRLIASTIAEALEPGYDEWRDGVHWQVRSDDGATAVLRNGIVVHDGDGAVGDGVLIDLARELGGASLSLKRGVLAG